MGTRHLIEVKYDGETRIAQYGQWDGYPSGQGVEILKFLSNKSHKDKWLKALKRCRFFKDDDEISEMFPSMDDESEDNIPPQLHRDTGSKILELVYNAKGKTYLVDARGWKCQYYYTIDMDNDIFHVRSNNGELNQYFSLERLPTDEEFSKACGGLRT